MTAHELARMLLGQPDEGVEVWDPDGGCYRCVTGALYGAGAPWRLLTDSDEEVGIEGLCCFHGGDDDPATCRECHPKECSINHERKEP